MKDYHINIFFSDEVEGYIADIPELAMCSAFGATPSEALAELERALGEGRAMRSWASLRTSTQTCSGTGASGTASASATSCVGGFALRRNSRSSSRSRAAKR